MVINEAVSGLLLDERNPRFREAVSSQGEAVTELLLDAAEKLINLAQDIAAEGSLNPTELPVAVEEDGGLVVIEGNRRLAALKLLRHPELAATAADSLGLPLVKRFKQLQQVGLGPESIDIFRAKSREAARHWIELRHTGENNGVGILGWKSWQTNNYRRKRGSQADRATVFCEAVESDYPHDTDLLFDVTEVRQNKLTTLGRLVTDPEIRYNFGFQFIDDEVVFDFESDKLHSGFSRIFRDLATKSGGVSVTDIKSKEQRRKYIVDRCDVLPDRASRLSFPRRPGEHGNLNNSGVIDQLDNLVGVDSTSEVGPDKSGNPVTNRNATQTLDRKESHPTTGNSKNNLTQKTPPLENVIFKSLKTPNFNSRIRELLSMAQKINIIDSAPVSGILVRVLLELAVTDAINKGVVTGVKENDSLKKKMRHALLALDPNCDSPLKRNKDFDMAWIRTQDQDALAVQSLNAFVHNIHGGAAPTEVRTLSATFRPVLQGLDNLIGNK